MQSKAKVGSARKSDGGEARQQRRRDPDSSPDSEEWDELGKAFQIAFEQGDDRAVLQCWSSLKKCEQAPPLGSHGADHRHAPFAGHAGRPTDVRDPAGHLLHDEKLHGGEGSRR